MIARFRDWFAKVTTGFSQSWWHDLERREWRTVPERPHWNWATWDRVWPKKDVK